MPPTPKDVISQAFAEYALGEEKSRLKEVEKLVDFYNAHHGEYIEQYINRESETDIPWAKSKITKKVIQRRAQVYKSAPLRKFDGEPDEDYDDLVGFKNRKMKSAERMALLLGMPAVRPVYDEMHQRLYYHILRQYLIADYDPVTLKPTAILYPIGGDNDVERLWAYWDAENHYIVDMKGEPVNGDIQQAKGVNEDLENPYQMIPFAFLANDELYPGEHPPAALDLIDAHEKIDVAMTDLNYAIRYNAFKQPYVIGQNIDVGKLETGYNKLMVNDSENGDIGVLDLNTNLMQIADSIKFQIQRIERDWDLAGTWSIEGNAPSGYSLVVQNLDLLRGWEDDLEFAREWEMDLYEIERRVMLQDAQKELPDVDTFAVDFAEVEFPINPEEERQRWAFEFEHNIATQIDYMQEKSPDTPEDELIQQVEENIRLNKQFRLRQTATLEERARVVD